MEWNRADAPACLTRWSLRTEQMRDQMIRLSNMMVLWLVCDYLFLVFYFWLVGLFVFSSELVCKALLGCWNLKASFACFRVFGWNIKEKQKGPAKHFSEKQWDRVLWKCTWHTLSGQIINFILVQIGSKSHFCLLCSVS